MLTYCTYAALSRSAGALPLNLIWSFETASRALNRKIINKMPKKNAAGRLIPPEAFFIGNSLSAKELGCNEGSGFGP